MAVEVEMQGVEERKEMTDVEGRRGGVNTDVGGDLL